MFCELQAGAAGFDMSITPKKLEPTPLNPGCVIRIFVDTIVIVGGVQSPVVGCDAGTLPAATPVTVVNGVVGGSNSCLIITAQTGDLLNGITGGSMTWCQTYGRLVLRPIGGTNWQIDSNDVQTSGVCPGSASTVSSVTNVTGTWSAATPTAGVFTATAHGITGACPVVFTAGSQSTGVVSGTVYWTIPASITTNTYAIASSVATALAGSGLVITGTAGSGQTQTDGAKYATTVAGNITGLTLSPGTWDCFGVGFRTLAATTSVTQLITSISATSATVGTEGDPGTNYTSTAANVMAANTDVDVGPTRLNLTAATNYYLVVKDTFTVSTNSQGGSLTCRRAL